MPVAKNQALLNSVLIALVRRARSNPTGLATATNATRNYATAPGLGKHVTSTDFKGHNVFRPTKTEKATLVGTGVYHSYQEIPEFVEENVWFKAQERRRLAMIAATVMFCLSVFTLVNMDMRNEKVDLEKTVKKADDYI